MKKVTIFLALALSASVVSASELVEAIVVRVGDRIVTRTQYAKRLQDGYNEIQNTVSVDQQAAKKKDYRDNLINELISEMLVKDRADHLGLSVSSEEIRDAVGRMKAQYNITNDADFNESLTRSGLTRADMESKLRDSLLTNKVFSRELRSRDDLSDRELRERYDRERERYRLPERAHLREIVILRPDDAVAAQRAEQRSNELAAQARSAADFGKLASTSSESATKDKGGDLGEVARGELLPDLDHAVFNAASGSVIGPIATKSGWHILKVETRLPSEVPAFESLKVKLRQDLSEESFQRDYKAYIDRLRKDAYIQIDEQNIPKT